MSHVARNNHTRSDLPGKICYSWDRSNRCLKNKDFIINAWLIGVASSSPRCRVRTNVELPLDNLTRPASRPTDRLTDWQTDVPTDWSTYQPKVKRWICPYQFHNAFLWSHAADYRCICTGDRVASHTCHYFDKGSSYTAWFHSWSH